MTWVIHDVTWAIIQDSWVMTCPVIQNLWYVLSYRTHDMSSWHVMYTMSYIGRDMNNTGHDMSYTWILTWHELYMNHDMTWVIHESWHDMSFTWIMTWHELYRTWHELYRTWVIHESCHDMSYKLLLNAQPLSLSVYLSLYWMIILSSQSILFQFVFCLLIVGIIVYDSLVKLN